MGTYFRYICGLSRIEYELYGRDYRRHADLAVDGTDYGDRALGRNQRFRTDEALAAQLRIYDLGLDRPLQPEPGLAVVGERGGVAGEAGGAGQDAAGGVVDGEVAGGRLEAGHRELSHPFLPVGQVYV